MLKNLGVALTAGLVGAGVALLLAPARGRDTRRQIARGLDRRRRLLTKRMNRDAARLLERGGAAVEDATAFVHDELQAAQKRLQKVVPI
jgi:gas vesicle protein